MWFVAVFVLIDGRRNLQTSLWGSFCFFQFSFSCTCYSNVVLVVFEVSVCICCILPIFSSFVLFFANNSFRSLIWGFELTKYHGPVASRGISVAKLMVGRWVFLFGAGRTHVSFGKMIPKKRLNSPPGTFGNLLHPKRIQHQPARTITIFLWQKFSQISHEKTPWFFSVGDYIHTYPVMSGFFYKTHDIPAPPYTRCPLRTPIFGGG